MKLITMILATGMCAASAIYADTGTWGHGEHATGEMFIYGPWKPTTAAGVQYREGNAVFREYNGHNIDFRSNGVAIAISNVRNNGHRPSQSRDFAVLSGKVLSVTFADANADSSADKGARWTYTITPVK
jgi:hypothetical protein